MVSTSRAAAPSLRTSQCPWTVFLGAEDLMRHLIHALAAAGAVEFTRAGTSADATVVRTLLVG